MQHCPHVFVAGDANHADFAATMALLRSTATVSNFPTNHDAATSPEIILVAQSRPGQIKIDDLNTWRRRWPLAGVVSLLGTWCEGEARTSRPLPNALRLYWYEFAAWWRLQLHARSLGRCPAWSRPATDVYRLPNGQATSIVSARDERGPIAIRAPRYEVGETLADICTTAGFSALLNSPTNIHSQLRGIVAGLWDGGQLSDQELHDLAMFCRSSARQNAPIIALLDFPRSDRVTAAMQVGVAQVIGKPWHNDELTATIIDQIRRTRTSATNNTRAA